MATITNNVIELSRLSCEGHADVLFACTKYDGNNLSLQVSDGKSNSWQGISSKEELEIMAEESSMPLIEYLEETVKALSHEDLEFMYSAELSESGMLRLTWKKQLSGGVRFKLGSMDLSPSDFQATNRFLLDYSIDRMQSLFQKVSKLDRECSRLENERRTALNLVQKYSSIKDETEKDLYGKFKLILNEKKSKIRKLIELKDHLTDQNEEMKRVIWNAKSTAQPIKGESLVAVVEEQDKKGTSSDSHPQSSAHKPETLMKSLLCDAGSCRPPSPPPVKKQRLMMVSEKGKIEIPHPPPLSSTCTKAKLQPQNNSKDHKNVNDSDVSMDELIDMI